VARVESDIRSYDIGERRLALLEAVATLAMLCEITDMSVCAAWRPLSEV
jgi:hypothetical protein